MKRKFDVIATVGNYTDQATGKKVKRTLPVGTIYESTGGKLVLRLDAIPVATEFSGWMQLRPCSANPRAEADPEIEDTDTAANEQP